MNWAFHDSIWPETNLRLGWSDWSNGLIECSIEFSIGNGRFMVRISTGTLKWKKVKTNEKFVRNADEGAKP